DNMQKTIKAIDGITYFNAILQSMYSARSASRSMVHQVLTNISNLSLSNYSGSAVGAENQFVQSKVQDLTSITGDLINHKQKIYDANAAQKNSELKRIAGIIGTVLSGVCIAILIACNALPSIGTCFSLLQGVSGLFISAYSLYESIVSAIALNDLAKKEQEELDDATEKGKEILKRKVSYGADGEAKEADASEISGEDGGTKDLSNTSGKSGAGAKVQLSMMQANLKKMERVNALLRKVAQAKRESRGKVTAKISGISGSSIPTSADAVAGLEAGAADAIMSQLVQKAAALEAVNNKQDSSFEKILGAATGLVTSAIGVAKTGVSIADGSGLSDASGMDGGFFEKLGAMVTEYTGWGSKETKAKLNKGRVNRVNKELKKVNA
ncbi:hypothetical protein NO1_2267, partial [Candidatus Termititenax aidoneus]